jgi:hypothetical protein
MSARPTRSLAPARRVGVVALLMALLVTGLTAGAAQADLPSKAQWLTDTEVAMAGSRVYVGQRAGVSAVGRKLAVNLDIDNTSLASHYDFGAPVPVVLRLARYARAHGVLLLFNTGRASGAGRLVAARRQLAAAGYRVTELCGRRPAETLVQGKQRCRRQFVASGYTIIANIGNRSTDFLGGNYERAFRLPDYDGQLA